MGNLEACRMKETEPEMCVAVEHRRGGTLRGQTKNGRRVEQRRPLYGLDSDHWSHPSATADERHQEKHDENDETDLRNPRGRSGHTAKAQDSGDQCHHKKSQCPAQHNVTFRLRI
jgi:hypothetical protein